MPLAALIRALPLALSLAGAPALAQVSAPPDDDAATAPDGAPLPEGDGCAGAVARWQDFAGRESRGGHMGLSVYNQIQNEVDRAERLCRAGQDAQARRAVAESKRRHGYAQ